MTLMRSLGGAIAAVFAMMVISGAATDFGAAYGQELRISHQFPAQVDSRDRATRVFVAELVKRAPHLKVSVHPALSLGFTPIGQFDALQSGELEMSVYPLTYATAKAPELSIAWFPFVPADLDMASRLKGSAFHRRLQSLAEANGIHIVTWWWLPSGLASRVREIGGPQTVKGMNVRFGDASFENLFVQAGARGAPFIPTTEVVAALRDGKLDGVMTTIESLLSFRIYEQTKYATFGGVGGMMTITPLVISKSVWDGLTVDERAAIEEAADVSDAYFVSQQREIEQMAVEAFTKAGAQVRRLTIDEYEAWSSIAKETVWPQYRKLSPTADAVFVALMTSLIQSGQAAPRQGSLR